jgi:hypothetical protein
MERTLGREQSALAASLLENEHLTASKLQLEETVAGEHPSLESIGRLSLSPSHSIAPPLCAELETRLQML